MSSAFRTPSSAAHLRNTELGWEPQPKMNASVRRACVASKCPFHMLQESIKEQTKRQEWTALQPPAGTSEPVPTVCPQGRLYRLP